MESRNIALQGTLCTNGSGVGICVGLGDGTVFGRIAKQATSERTARTTLEVEILRVVIIIASLALAVAILIVSMSTFLVRTTSRWTDFHHRIVLWAAWLRPDHPGFITVPILLVDCVSVAVAFIPGTRGYALPL
jgi:sodium/potassium-transporting ATPase subunit alpha